jgi:hypothetical protein
MPFEERMEKLAQIKEYLIEERNFAMSCKDWPRVTVFRNKLKLHAEQVAKVRHVNKIRQIAA